jgi:hypothetical protein
VDGPEKGPRLKAGGGQVPGVLAGQRDLLKKLLPNRLVLPNISLAGCGRLRERASNALLGCLTTTWRRIMALDERARHELFLRLEEVLGPKPAETLMELMPPVGWADVATKRDLDALEQRIDLRFEAMDHKFEAMDHKLEALKHELLATIRGELLTTVTAQTRTVVVANLGAVLSVAALAFGAARLA